MSYNKPDENKINLIHTFESDLASAVMDNNYGKNIIKIITNPKENSTFKEDLIKEGWFSGKKKIIILFLISLILIFLYILYKTKNKEIPVNSIDLENMNELENQKTVIPDEPVFKYNDIINPEILQSNNFTKLNKVEIISEINKIKLLLIENKVAPSNNIGINSNLNISQLFEKINYSGDNALLRSFNENYAFGLYLNEKNQFENYLLIEVNNFDLSFKSILDWEKYIPVDLKDLFIGNNEIINLTSTTTSTTTLLAKRYYKNNTTIFMDKVLKNYDVREYVDNKNNMYIIYGFVNNKYLLLTSGESSFLDIKNRLLKENIAR